VHLGVGSPAATSAGKDGLNSTCTNEPVWNFTSENTHWCKLRASTGDWHSGNGKRQCGGGLGQRGGPGRSRDPRAQNSGVLPKTSDARE
jgi:hypothetical protein